MDEGSECECSFTIEEMRSDDPRLKQLLEIPEEEKQSSFSALIQLISGSDGLEIEDVGLWNQFHLTDEDFNRLLAIGLKGKLRVARYRLGDFRVRSVQGSDTHCGATSNKRGD
jgi:hypothetical protein